MAINANEDTEFNDALRKHGILPPRPVTPPSPSPPASPTLSDFLDDLTPSQVRAQAESTQNEITQRLMEEYAAKRREEEKREERLGRFGRVYPIGREDYTREVTDASSINEEDDEDERGTGVVCFLYKDGVERSDVAKQHIDILARRHPRTKFVSIVGDKCIPNLPDTRIPMFIVYRKGDVLNQLVSWGADRPRKIEELEALLIVAGAIIVPEKNRRSSPSRGGGSSDEDGDSEEEERDRDPSSRMRSAATSTNARTMKNIRRTEKEDSDSDFDL